MFELRRRTASWLLVLATVLTGAIGAGVSAAPMAVASPAASAATSQHASADLGSWCRHHRHLCWCRHHHHRCHHHM